MQNSGNQPPLEPAAANEMDLQRLSQAFAAMLGGEHSAGAVSESSPEAPSGESPGESPHAACDVIPRSIVESMLFLSRPDNQPITAEQLAGLMRGVTPPEVEQHIADLNARYNAQQRPYEIIRQGFGYRMTLRSQYAPLREKYIGRMRRVRLSQAAIEVLAL